MVASTVCASCCCASTAALRGIRSRLSTMIRSGCRRDNSPPGLAVNRGLSRNTVPMPTRTASHRPASAEPAPRRFIGNPLGFASGRSDLPIQRHTGLQDGKGSAVLHPVDVGLVELPGFGLATTDFDLYPCPLQLRNSSPRTCGFGSTMLTTTRRTPDANHQRNTGGALFR